MGRARRHDLPGWGCEHGKSDETVRLKQGDEQGCQNLRLLHLRQIGFYRQLLQYFQRTGMCTNTSAGGTFHHYVWRITKIC
jgi:hypothetical protein